MSEYAVNTLSKRFRDLDVSPQFDGYSGVELIVDDDTGYFAGTRSGRVITITNPWGTQAQANNILAAIQGFQYQPYAAEDALLSPAAELGDGVSMTGLYSGIYRLNKRFTPLMAADIQGPEDEEINHEYPYQTETDRVYKRELAETRAQISITATQIAAEVTRATEAEGTLASRITQTDSSITAEVVRATEAEGKLSTRITQTDSSITAEVTRATEAEEKLSTRITQTDSSITAEVVRATEAEGKLSTRITQTANDITAEVTRAKGAEGTLRSSITQNAESITAKVSKTGGSSSSFAWALTDSSWALTSGSKTVLKATSSGLEVSGKITASSGQIGDLSIKSNAIYTGLTALYDTAHDGVYICAAGIALGRGKFRVTSAGDLKATSVDLTGKITASSGAIGGFTIGSSSIYNGMTSLTDTTHDGVYVGTNGLALGKGAFKVTSAGALTAKSGTVGGFTISASAIYNGVTSLSDTAHNGVYLGTNGIVCGKGAFKVTSGGAVTASNLTITGGSIVLGSNFKVTSAGNVTANNMTLTGTLTIGGQSITAEALRAGAAKAYSSSGTWDNTSSTVSSNSSRWSDTASTVGSNSSRWSTGAGYGYNYNSATDRYSGQYPGYFRATVINCEYLALMDGIWGLSHAGISYDQWHYVPKQMTVVTGVSINGWVNVVATNGLTRQVASSIGVNTAILYYLGRQ